MKQIGTRTVTTTVVVALLLTGLACSSKNETASDQKMAQPPTTETAINDPRLSPERKAALEQTIAQQKASADWVDKKMRASAARSKP